MRKNFSYKAIAYKDGVILLFETFTEFDEKDVNVNYFEGNTYVEAGDNVFLLTPNIINQLLNTPRLFFCVGDFNAYEALSFVKEICVDVNITAQLMGILLVLQQA